MKWVAISGTWKVANKKVEEDVRKAIRSIISTGGGVVTGGALNVDYFATDEFLKIEPTCKRIKIFLPTTLDVYASHYRKRSEEGVITKAQAEELIKQLKKIKSINPKALIENPLTTKVDKTTYFERNNEVIRAADELIAFRVNKSEGVSDAIAKAKKSNIPTKVFDYSIM
ncbi:MAG: hypothetical protein A2Z11_00100 [Candidatus Woykebacteria bacterium RBG_16_43_9]|uniref:Uncharacterized protein n=1 Tax=Candidatus Woykebacteria bacterium RBG_16_43_9 TaxID=1802596 RepID=A0A1G1WBV8_9BACT|nr:MAG: hypothetical protein A2Z11_00100 [Candidatus Woykebacteria bacterium RBG_16_43_9]